MPRYTIRRRSLCPANIRLTPVDEITRVIDEFRTRFSLSGSTPTIEDFNVLLTTAHVIADELERRVDLSKRSMLSKNLTET